MREIEFFSVGTIYNSSIKIPPGADLEAAQGDLKPLAVLEIIGVSMSSRIIRIDNDNHLYNSIVSRNLYRYFEAPKSLP